MKTRGGNRYLFLLFTRFSIVCSVIFVAHVKLATATYGFPNFYYYCNEKIHLDLSTKIITIRFIDNVSEQKKEAVIKADATLKGVSNERLPFGLVLTETEKGLDKIDIPQAVQRLNKLPEVKYCTPVFLYRSLKLILTDQFIVRFKPDITEQDIQILNKQNGVAVVRKSPDTHNRYLLHVINPKDRNAIEVANIYNENPQTEYAAPNFVIIGAYQNTYPDDTYFNQQWPLHNTGQVPPGGTDDADIDAPEGWEITTGSSNIIIAVLDFGGCAGLGNLV